MNTLTGVFNVRVVCTYTLTHIQKINHRLGYTAVNIIENSLVRNDGKNKKNKKNISKIFLGT